MATDVNQDEPIPPQTGDRGEPTSPLDLTAPDWKASLRRAVGEFKADRGTLTSAGMAFYWFLAIFPALLAAVGFIGLVGVGQEFVDDLSRPIRSTLPGQAADVLTDALTKATDQSQGSSVVAALAGTALALWGASAGMVALQVGLDVVYDVPEDRTFVKKRLRALLLIVVAAVLGGVATALIVFGQPLGEALRDDLPFGSAFVLLWTLIRWALGIGALTVLFAAFYYLGPNRETPRWTWISPGGVVATLIWLAASLGFSFYVSSVGSYARTYGSLTGVVVLLLWLYLAALAIVLGGEINAELERQGEKRRRRRRGGRQERATSAQAPGPQRPDPGGDGEARRAEADPNESEWLRMMQRMREGSRQSGRQES